MELEYLDAIIVAALRHHGAHTPDETASSWEDLILWASPRRLLGRRFDVRGVGILWDDPRQFLPEDRRYDVAIPIDAEDSSEVEEPTFLLVLNPGEYLKVTHEGAYDEISRTYDQAFDVTMKIENLELTAAPIIELYRNSPSEVD